MKKVKKTPQNENPKYFEYKIKKDVSQSTINRLLDYLKTKNLKFKIINEKTIHIEYTDNTVSIVGYYLQINALDTQGRITINKKVY